MKRRPYIQTQLPMKTKLTRREVLQSLAAGFALAALPRTGAAAETHAASGGFRCPSGLVVSISIFDV